MPRPVTHRHVLRDLRNTIKRTQAQFAKLLGVSRVYVNKIENGQMQISPSLALRVHALTGISVDELAMGSEGKLVDLTGRQYRPETFAWWQKKLRQPSEKDTIMHVRNLRWWTHLLLRAAVSHQGGVAYYPVLTALNQSLSIIRQDFGLEETTGRLLRECDPPLKWQPGGRTPQELRQIDRELKMAQAQAEAQAQLHAAAKITWHPRSKRPSKKKRHR